MQFFDTISLGQAVEVTGARETRNGSLVINARAARGGNVQDYLGIEVEKPEMPVVRVYRDADEIFNKDRLRTYGNKPVTLDHPAHPVTSRTWRDVARGHTGDEVLRDGEFIRIPMMVSDQTAIDAVKAGKRELSVGYQCDLDFTPGTTPDGHAYDARQVNILVDHVAIVDRGRAGKDCRIGDGAPSDDGKTMRALLPDPPSPPQQQRDALPMKTLMIDGHSVALDDAAFIAVSALQRSNATLTADNLRLTGDLGTATAAHAKALADKDGETLKLQADHKVVLDAKDARITELEGQALTADKLDAAVAERAAVLDAAKPILGATFDAKGRTVADIRRTAVAKRLGDAAVAGKADEHVAIAFDTLTAAGANAPDGLSRALADSGATHRPDTGNVVQMGDAAAEYAAMRERDRNAWKMGA